jgi:hypothetical protein
MQYSTVFVLYVFVQSYKENVEYELGYHKKQVVHIANLVRTLNAKKPGSVTNKVVLTCDEVQCEEQMAFHGTAAIGAVTGDLSTERLQQVKFVFDTSELIHYGRLPMEKR